MNVSTEQAVIRKAEGGNAIIGTTYLVSPAMCAGGTSTLFARLGLYLAANGYSRLGVVDYRGGYMSTVLREHGVDFEHREYVFGQPQEFGPDDCVFVNLLSGRMTGIEWLCAETTRLIFWQTHPDDAFKWVPSFQIYYQVANVWKRRMARGLHGSYFGRLQATYRRAVERGGLVFMDGVNRRSFGEVFGVESAGKILPIFCHDPDLPAIPASKGTGVRSFVWVGRLADFKWRAVNAIITELDRLAIARSTNYELTIVGSGSEAHLVKRHAANLRCLEVHFISSLPNAALAEFIRDQADVFIGQGTALIEACAAGVPALLIDGYYCDPLPGELRLRPAYEMKDGDLGEMIHDPKKASGELLGALVERIERDPHGEAVRCRQHWEQVHSPEAVGATVLRVLENNRFTFGDLRAAGALDFDLFGRLCMWAKQYLRRTNKAK